jgi:hypothetical protein
VQVTKKTVPPFTQLKLFSYGLKSMKVKFNIFPGQHNHRIWTPLNTLVSSGDWSQEQIPTSNISKANWRCYSRRMV